MPHIKRRGVRALFEWNGWRRVGETLWLLDV
jgi:hypothetical protein